ncbi:MAG TPA: HlyD family efflux transporter periplasmic adaptor subunit [Steroidobacteraceae bacterium]|nr:HlyD family efflux transporter periplasmic adaptor subunit [Steroidobacteraceae bacterium]
MKMRAAILALSALVAACAPEDPDDVVYGTIERHRVEIPAEAYEPVIRLAVTEGTHVAPGQVLLQLDTATVDARLKQNRAAVTQAREHLNELARGSRRQEIVEARAALDAANAELGAEAREYERLRELLARRLISQSVLDQAHARRESARGAQEQAAARLALRVEGSRVEAIAQANAALDEALAQQEQLELSARRYTVTAPVAATVEALPYRQGERPSVGATVIVLLADEPAFARVYVPASRRLQFAPGAKTSVHIDGRAAALSGTVRFISAQAAFTPYYALTRRERSRLSYLAEIDLPSARDVPVGIPAQVVLPRAERR